MSESSACILKRYAYDGKLGDRYWRLYVWYDLDKQSWGVPDNEFATAIGYPDGAGTGCGQRDMDWAFADEISAITALSCVKQIIGSKPGFRSDIALCTVEEDEAADDETAAQ